MSNQHPLVKAVADAQLRTDIPAFSSGDTIVVQVQNPSNGTVRTKMESWWIMVFIS